MFRSIEILPKRRFEHSASNTAFVQSTAQAIDTGGYNFISLEAWAWNLQTGDTLDIMIQEATVNEDDAFVLALNSPASGTIISLSGSSGATRTATAFLPVFSRFVRLSIGPSLSSGNIVDVRARLNLKQFP